METVTQYTLPTTTTKRKEKNSELQLAPTATMLLGCRSYGVVRTVWCVQRRVAEERGKGGQGRRSNQEQKATQVGSRRTKEEAQTRRKTVTRGTRDY
jgi:hypothetical protein